MAAAIPLFFVAIAVEMMVARHRRRDVYVFADSISSLSCGVLQQVTSLWIKALMLWVYYSLFRSFGDVYGVAAAMPTALRIAVLFVLVDHQYYWFHRASHRVGFLWAAHSVHHQSEEYNLTTALRQSAIQMLFSAVFYMPLALLGFDTVSFVTAVTLNTLYQFWIHTRLVRKLPRTVEWIFNTPSHHRVHHGIDNQYLDRNHAGVFMLWDRVFGTFEPEAHEPTYGTVTQLGTWNPLRANIVGWTALSQKSKAAHTLGDKLYAWVAPPEWLPQRMREAAELREGTRTKFTTRPLPTVQQLRLSIEFAVVGLAVLWLGVSDQHPVHREQVVQSCAQILVATFIALATLRWSKMLRRR